MLLFCVCFHFRVGVQAGWLLIFHAVVPVVALVTDRDHGEMFLRCHP